MSNQLTLEKLLALVLVELRGLRADMAKTAVSALPPSDLVDIREPAATPLPADFPGGDALAEAGIVCWETLPRDGDALTSIPGIGRVTAGQILGRLAK